jgi:hypothetical protein
MSVSELKAKLFTRQSFVCGGHGARRPSHGSFTVPKGITIHFYVPDTDSLPNDIGQKVDQVLTGKPAPAATETLTAGDRCHNYHLYSSKAGGYLNLAMSSKADERYITTTDKDNGVGLKDILDLIIGKCPVAEVHWSACRSTEDDGDSFDWDEPDYSQSPALLALSKK